MLKNTCKKYLLKLFSITLALAMMISVPVNALATSDTHNSSTKITDDLKVRTKNAGVEKSIVSFDASYPSRGVLELSIVVSNSFLQEYPELKLSIYSSSEREPIYENVFGIGKEADVIRNLSLDTNYRVMAVGSQDVSVENIFGSLTVRDKDGTPFVEYKLTHDTHYIREYGLSHIRTLRTASELLMEADSKYDCVDNERSVLDYRAVPAEEVDMLMYAEKVLSDSAKASIRYEVEPNDSISSAYRVYDDDTTYGTIGYSGDVDYFRVQFTSSGSANFWLGDIPSGVDYDLYLYDSYGNQLQSSTTTANHEQIYEYPVTANEWYYLRVVGYNNSYDASNYYRIRAKNYPSVQYGDSFEPNDSYADATSISNNALLTTANIDNDADVDYFRFTVSSSSSVSISLSNIPSNCDYDLFLYDSGYSQCASSRSGGNTSEVIEYTVSAGTYYIVVESYSGSSSSNYRLNLSTSISYNSDSYEPNNTMSAATYLSSSTSLYATIHNSTDVDYYRLVITTPRSVSISLSNIPANCDYDLELWDSSHVIARSLNGGTSVETINTTLSVGTYYIRVFPHSGYSGATYRLTVSLGSPTVYGNFSRNLSTPTVPSNITTPLATIEDEFDVWPAGEISRYYGLTNTQRIELLTSVHQAALATAVGGVIFPPASSYLFHFLTESGAVKTIDVADFMNDDSSAVADRNTEFNAALEAAEALAVNGGTVTFCSILHSEYVPTDRGWKYSVGTYSTKVKCTVTRSGSAYTATIEYYLYDVYDWDRSLTSMDNLPVSPRDMWELQYGGLAKGYYSNGSESYTVSWNSGQRIGSGAVVE